MKKLLFSILIAILAIPAFAGTKLVTGSLADLKGAKSVPFIVNWDGAVYSKAGTLADFLDKAVRNNDGTRGISCHISATVRLSPTARSRRPLRISKLSNPPRTGMTATTTTQLCEQQQRAL